MSLFSKIANVFTPKPRYLAVIEYWIYTSDSVPVNVGGSVAKLTRNGTLTPAEAALASDIRLYASQVMKEQNPHLFRPDLFDGAIEPTAESLAAIASCNRMIKLRYLSDVPLADLRHVGFLPRLAVELARTKKSEAVLDNVSQKLYTPVSLEQSLLDGEDRYAPGDHLRSYWEPMLDGGRAVTRGLLKAGIQELETPETRADHRLLVTEVLSQAADKLWRGEANPNLIHVSCYDDLFVVRVKPTKNGPSLARVLRLHES